jgi:hypothetical protein
MYFHPEEYDSVATMHDFRLLLVDGELQLFFKILACLFQGVLRSAFRPGKDKDIVRIADEAVTTPLHLLVKRAQTDIS